MAGKGRPIAVTPRHLVSVLRREAAAFAPDRRARNLWAEIAARDMVSAGRVRLVGQPERRRAA